MLDQFSITQRHYNIIIEQVQKNYPYESGGFIGGKDGVITAIFPVLNQDISNKTDVFAIYPQDIERAHLFLKNMVLNIMERIIRTQKAKLFLPSRI